VLLNVLSNALKFTPAGGRVTICAQPERDGGCRIAVEDNGIGMAPGSIPDRAGALRQIDSSLARKYGGTGLGLPLARRFAILLGGGWISAALQARAPRSRSPCRRAPAGRRRPPDTRRAAARRQDRSGQGFLIGLIADARPFRAAVVRRLDARSADHQDRPRPRMRRRSQATESLPSTHASPMIDDPPLLTIRRKFDRPERSPGRCLRGHADRLHRRCDGGPRGARLPGSSRCRARRRGSWHGAALPQRTGRQPGRCAPPPRCVRPAMCSWRPPTASAAVRSSAICCWQRQEPGRGRLRQPTGSCATSRTSRRWPFLPSPPASRRLARPQRAGTVGLPVVCGGLPVAAGDIVIGDPDGIVIVPRAEIAAVLTRLAVVRANEAKMLKAVQAGSRSRVSLAAILGQRPRALTSTSEACRCGSP